MKIIINEIIELIFMAFVTGATSLFCLYLIKEKDYAPATALIFMVVGLIICGIFGTKHLIESIQKINQSKPV